MTFLTVHGIIRFTLVKIKLSIANDTEDVFEESGLYLFLRFENVQMSFCHQTMITVRVRSIRREHMEVREQEKGRDRDED